MARLLLNTSPTTHHATLSISTRVKPQLSPALIEESLRQPRSAAYMAAMTQLDSGGHTHNAGAMQNLLSALEAEFPGITVEHFPIGIVSKCFLGAPFEVHTLDREGGIIRHYKMFESLPGLLESARTLALHPSYIFIEVYTDKIVPVAASGAVSIVGNGSATQF